MNINANHCSNATATATSGSSTDTISDTTTNSTNSTGGTATTSEGTVSETSASLSTSSLSSSSLSSLSSLSSFSSLSSYGGAADLTYLYRCEACFGYALPPIFQCTIGHLICVECYHERTLCPTCKIPLNYTRNLALEKLASRVKFPCKFNGCDELRNYTELKTHEDTCNMRPCVCPCPGVKCNWQGARKKLIRHLKKSHWYLPMLVGANCALLACNMNISNTGGWTMVQNCFGRYFLLIVEKRESSNGHQQVFALVQIIGSQNEAKQYMYCVELNANRLRYTWEAMTRSIHDGIASTIDASDCLVVDGSVAERFVDEHGHLLFAVTISKF